MKNKLLLIREWIWPLLELDELEKDIESDIEQSFKIEDENLDLALQLQLKIFQEEEDRRKGTESKAALFMGSLSVANSIVIGANTLIWGKDIPGEVIKISVIISVFLAIYTIRTVWFSVKVLERGAYHVMGFEDINMTGDKNQYKQQLIKSLSAMIKANEKNINTKVDNLVMAQEYYKRAILVICLYAFSVLLFSIFHK